MKKRKGEKEKEERAPKTKVRKRGKQGKEEIYETKGEVRATRWLKQNGDKGEGKEERRRKRKHREICWKADKKEVERWERKKINGKAK